MAKHTIACGVSCRCKPLLAALALLVALAALPAWARGERWEAARQTGDSGPTGRAAPSATTAAPHVSSKTTAAPPGFTRPERMRPSRHFSTRTRGKTRITRFYNVVVKDRPHKGDPTEHGITVRVGGNKILDYDNYEGDYADVRAFRNYPRRGMSTLFVRTYSGGAHCCNTYFLLTRLAGAGSSWIRWSWDTAGDFMTPTADWPIHRK